MKMLSNLFLFFVLISIVEIIGQEYDEDEYYDDDPELMLCDELRLDAAVTADDNIGYVFKGDFYWQLSTISGISPNFIARYISQRWEGLTGPIDASFTIDDKTYGFTTVFIKGNEWFLYKMKKFQTKGLLEDWPYIFTERPVMTAFEFYNSSLERKDYHIYILFDTNKFSEYIFHDIQRPTFVATGTTGRISKILYFVVDPNKSLKNTLDSMISASAVMTNEQTLMIFGDKNYCSADITECLNPKTEMSSFFGCPRSEFPTTTISTTTTTTHSTTTLSTTTIKRTNKADKHRTTTPKTKSTKRTKTKRTRHPTFASKPTFNYDNIATTTTTTTTTQRQITDPPLITTTETPPDDNQGTITSTEPEEESDDESVTEKTNKKQKSGLIIIVIIIVFFCLIILFVILFLVMKNNLNKRKKSSDNSKGKEMATDIEKSDSSVTSGKEPTDSSSKRVDNKSSDLKTPSNDSEMPSEAAPVVPSTSPATPKTSSIRSESIESLDTSDAKHQTNPSKASEADQMMDKIKSETDSD